MESRTIYPISLLAYRLLLQCPPFSDILTHLHAHYVSKQLPACVAEMWAAIVFIVDVHSPVGGREVGCSVAGFLREPYFETFRRSIYILDELRNPCEI